MQASSASVHTDPLMPSYAGEIDPRQAWKLLQEDSASQLIDVRTAPEWIFTGSADLRAAGKSTLLISWKHYPSHQINPNFIGEVESALGGAPKNTTLICMCRTGGRSLDAAVALTNAGYTQCFNLTDGFEGPQNGAGQRGTVAGWKASQLPWEQQ